MIVAWLVLLRFVILSFLLLLDMMAGAALSLLYHKEALKRQSRKMNYGAIKQAWYHIPIFCLSVCLPTLLSLYQARVRERHTQIFRLLFAFPAAVTGPDLSWEPGASIRSLPCVAGAEAPGPSSAAFPS